MFTSFLHSVDCMHHTGIKRLAGKRYPAPTQSNFTEFFHRSVICGITEDTENGHILRATLEAICYQVRDILDAMAKDCGIPLVRLQVDGGMTSNDLLLQLQADLIGLSVLRPAMTESTALVCLGKI